MKMSLRSNEFADPLIYRFEFEYIVEYYFPRSQKNGFIVVPRHEARHVVLSGQKSKDGCLEQKKHCFPWDRPIVSLISFRYVEWPREDIIRGQLSFTVSRYVLLTDATPKELLDLRPMCRRLGVGVSCRWLTLQNALSKIRRSRNKVWSAFCRKGKQLP
jgi:hypothetical protein